MKGWDGGLAWITTNTLLARYNQAAVLSEGDLSAMTIQANPKNPNQARQQNRLRNLRVGGVNVEKILTEKERSDKDVLVTALETRLLQGALKEKQEQTVRDYLATKGDLDESEIRSAIRLVMSTPEYQLT